MRPNPWVTLGFGWALLSGAAGEDGKWTGQWKALKGGCTPRFAHTAVWDDQKGVMLVFGGENHVGKEFSFFNDMWTFAPKTQAWKQVETSGPVPPQRAYHAAAWDPKRACLWMFGGCGGDFVPMGDLWRFTPATGKWVEVTWKGDGPGPRFNQALHVVEAKGTLLLHSGSKGFGAADSAWEDLWIFDPEAGTWASHACPAPGRWQFASALDQKRGLFIRHGGFDGQAQVQNDTWIYDLEKDSWKEGPAGLSGTDAHIAVWDDHSGAVLFFGGAKFKSDTGLNRVAVFDAEGKWSEAKMSGKPLKSRAYHSAVWAPSLRGMLVFGGTENQFSSPMQKDETLLLEVKP